MIKLVAGDTVLVKHPKFTDGKWKKKKIYVADSGFYEIRFSTGDSITVGDNVIIYDCDIIKVDSNFKMECSNCKHRMEPANTEPCCKCVFHDHYYWEPCDSLKNKDKLIGNDIKTFSIDEGPFTDKKVNYSYISTSRCNTVNMLERQMHEQLLASPLKIAHLDMKSMYPDLKGGYKLDYSKNRIEHCINTERDLVEFMADFNKKENKDMKQQQKKRDRNIIKVKDLETRKIKDIMFNGPATIIKWDPTWAQLYGDKTVTVCKEPDKFDKTTGFLLAVLKEVLTNQSYGNILEKIDEIKEFDELSKQTVEADLNNKTGIHCSIKDLEEQTKALENVYIPGSVVKYKNGKKYYKVLCYRFDEDLKEIIYILQAYKGNWFVDDGLENTRKRNVPHSKLTIVRRK